LGAAKGLEQVEESRHTSIRAQGTERQPNASGLALIYLKKKGKITSMSPVGDPLFSRCGRSAGPNDAIRIFNGKRQLARRKPDGESVSAPLPLIAASPPGGSVHFR